MDTNHKPMILSRPIATGIIFFAIDLFFASLFETNVVCVALVGCIVCSVYSGPTLATLFMVLVFALESSIFYGKILVPISILIPLLITGHMLSRFFNSPKKICLFLLLVHILIAPLVHGLEEWKNIVLTRYTATKITVNMVLTSLF